MSGMSGINLKSTRVRKKERGKTPLNTRAQIDSGEIPDIPDIPATPVRLAQHWLEAHRIDRDPPRRACGVSATLLARAATRWAHARGEKVEITPAILKRAAAALGAPLRPTEDGTDFLISLRSHIWANPRTVPPPPPPPPGPPPRRAATSLRRKAEVNP